MHGTGDGAGACTWSPFRGPWSAARVSTRAGFRRLHGADWNWGFLPWSPKGRLWWAWRHAAPGSRCRLSIRAPAPGGLIRRGGGEERSRPPPPGGGGGACPADSLV